MRPIVCGALRTIRSGTEIEALRDITCTIYAGEHGALIGHNGAGKTTFLRLVSGIYSASTGYFNAYGPVFPMIQKAFITGPELSGIDAVKGHYLLMHGTLKGFSEYLDQIIIFSELGDFIPLPMKGYSEGMLSRLLFALLTSGRHKCLALDEGLGAGDACFHERALNRLREFMMNTGTLIRAGHCDNLLRQFCDRGLVFKHGSLIFDGPLELS